MNQWLRHRVLNNAAANAAIGLSVAIYQVGVTAIMFRFGRDQQLAAWTLSVSFMSIVQLLCMGMSTIVARRCIELSDAPATTAMFLGEARRQQRQLLSLLAALVLGVFSLPLWLYRDVFTVDRLSYSVSIAAMTLGAGWFVYTQIDQGQLIAQQRNWKIALAVWAARTISMMVMLVAMIIAPGLIALPFILGGLSLWIAALLIRDRPIFFTQPQTDLTSLAERHAMRGLMRAFFVWNVCTALISGVMVPFVTLVEASSATGFYLAYTMVSVVTGLVGAATGALLAPMARQALKTERDSQGDYLLRATVLLLGSGMVVLLVLNVAGKAIVHAWTGDSSVHAVFAPFLYLLALQQVIRFGGAAAAILLTARAPSRLMALPALVELVAVVLVAVPAGIAFGAQKFVIGLIVAAAVATPLSLVLALRVSGSDNQKTTLAGIGMLVFSLAILALSCIPDPLFAALHRP